MRLPPCLPALIALLSLPCRAQVAPAALMEEEIRGFEAEEKDALALLASIKGHTDRIPGTVDLDALAEQVRAESSRLAKLVDDIFRRRNRFRVQANGLQVAILAAQVSAKRADKPAYDAAVSYRDATDRMTDAFVSLEAANNDAHQAFRRRLSLEKSQRRRARFAGRVKAGAAAAALLGTVLLLRRRRRAPAPPEPPGHPRPDGRHRPSGPARLE